MAITAPAQWWVRTGGNSANGCGFNSGISGAGTNYADADAAALTLTDLACNNSTTVTSPTGGFTAAMIGNAIRIASGTNFTAGYYFITARSDTNTVTVDRNPTNGGSASSGSGRIGGALALPTTLLKSTGPMVAGNVLNLRGSGTSDPSSADYDLSGEPYITSTSGTEAAGRIKLVGYNGRPHILVQGLFLYNFPFWTIESVKFKRFSGTPYYPEYGILHILGKSSLVDCIFDQGGIDGGLLSSLDGEIRACWLKNSGSTTAGTSIALNNSGAPNCGIYGCTITDMRGTGAALVGIMQDTVVARCGLHGITVHNSTADYPVTIDHNTVVACGTDGIRLDTGAKPSVWTVANNVIANNGGYGINLYEGTQAVTDRIAHGIRHNALYNNTSGAYNLLTAPASDITLTGNPFISSTDYRLNTTAGAGAAGRGAATPTTYFDTANNRDMGAMQHADPAGGSGGGPLVGSSALISA